MELLCTGSGITSDTQTNTNTDTDTNININNNININSHISRSILGLPHIQCFVPRVRKPRGKAMSGECTYNGVTCFDYANKAWRTCGNARCGFRNGPCTNKNRCAICMFEEQGPDACLCPRNIAEIRDARLKQLIRKHRVDRPAPAGLPDDLREDWDDKEALKAGPRGCVLCKAGPRECPLLSAPVGHIDTPSQSNEPIFVALPPGLHQAEPAAGHQAVPVARAAGAGCQPAAGAGCQPVDPAPVAAGPRPAPKAAPAPPPVLGRSAAAPSGAADAAGSVEFLNLDDGRAGAGTDAGRPGHDAILDGMQALRDGMGALEAAMATKYDMAALTPAMETGFDEMFQRLDIHGGPIVDNWFCYDCDFSFPSLQRLNSHRARVHGWFRDDEE